MKKKLPTIEQCLEYMDRYEMLDNIRDHSHVVALVSEVLLDALTQSNRATPPLPGKKETIAGALLHDIAKTHCIKNGGNHAEEGEQICRALGFPAIGTIVAEHVVLSDFNGDRYRQGIFTAGELVYYADKRVRHDKVVSLDARLEYIIERYGDANPLKEHHIRLNFKKILLFETSLFKFLDFEPFELSDHIQQKQTLTDSQFIRHL
jgi:putative nucleotidyltransferase with HDIG domain